jgi:uncharacterized DUF497 family protein
MEFEWDEAKSNACFADRGFDFGFAIRVFNDPDRVVEIDDRFDYGETRYRAIGRIDGRTYLVVYTMRHETLRVISARKANRKESIRHGQG